MPRKTGNEARAERLSWFAMILVFILISFDEDLTIPEFIIPFTIAAILFISGIYQYTRGWRISPLIWITGALLIAFALFDLIATIDLPIDLVLVSLIAVITVIVWGIISNES